MKAIKHGLEGEAFLSGARDGSMDEVHGQPYYDTS